MTPPAPPRYLVPARYSSSCVPVLFDLVHEHLRARHLSVLLIVQVLVTLFFSTALVVPSCADALNSSPAQDLAEVLWGVSIAAWIVTALANARYHSALWLVLAALLVVLETILLFVTDVSFCLDARLLGGNAWAATRDAATASTSILLAPALITSYAVPVPVIVLIRSLGAVLATLQVGILAGLVIVDVILPLRRTLRQRTNAWAEAQVTPARSRWLMLLHRDLEKALNPAPSSALSPEASFSGGNSLVDDDSSRGGEAVAFEGQDELPWVGRGAPRDADEEGMDAVLESFSRGGGRGSNGRGKRGRFCGNNGGGWYLCCCCCFTRRGACGDAFAVLPLRWQVAHILSFITLAVATLWALGPGISALLTAQRALEASIAAIDGAGYVCTANGGGPASSANMPASIMCALARAASAAQTAVPLGIFASLFLIVANLVRGGFALVSDHALRVTLRARRLLSAEAVAHLLGRGGMGTAGSLNSGGGSSGRGGATIPSEEERRAAAVAATAACSTASYRVGLDLIPATPGLTALHGLPSLWEASPLYALDYIPAVITSVLLAHIALSGALSCLALVALYAPFPRTLLLVTLAVALALVLIRVALYTALTACLDGSDAATGSRRLRSPRLFMLADALSLASPLAWAQAGGAALVRGVVALVASLVAISSPDVQLSPLGVWDPVFSSHAALVRLSFMDEPPPGFALKGIEAVVAAAAGTSTGGASMVADAPHVRTPLLDRRRLGGEEEGGNGGGEEGGYKWQHSASMDEGDEVGGGGAPAPAATGSVVVGVPWSSTAVRGAVPAFVSSRAGGRGGGAGLASAASAAMSIFASPFRGNAGGSTAAASSGVGNDGGDPEESAAGVHAAVGRGSVSAPRTPNSPPPPASSALVVYDDDEREERRAAEAAVSAAAAAAAAATAAELFGGDAAAVLAEARDVMDRGARDK